MLGRGRRSTRRRGAPSTPAPTAKPPPSTRTGGPQRSATVPRWCPPVSTPGAARPPGRRSPRPPSSSRLAFCGAPGFPRRVSARPPQGCAWPCRPACAAPAPPGRTGPSPTHAVAGGARTSRLGMSGTTTSPTWRPTATCDAAAAQGPPAATSGAASVVR